MSETVPERDESQALAAVAHRFGELLLAELDAPRRDALLDPDTAAVLAEVGVDVTPLREPDSLDELAASFLSTFLQPEDGAPLVQSLWTSGSYEGDAAVVVRQLAEAAGATYDKAAARGAPHDHLGSILILWATTADRVPEVADRLAKDHLRWALTPLQKLAGEEGFYADVARATADLVGWITAEV